MTFAGKRRPSPHGYLRLAAWRRGYALDDRFFPAEFQRRVVQERLGLDPDEMSGGHLPALAHPDELVEHLDRYWREVELSGTL